MSNATSTPPGAESAEPQASLRALLFSLSASALAAMGRELPGLPKQEKNLVVARHTIDLLEMLKVKTAGNRTPEESTLLDTLLYELRLAYVAAEEETVSQADRKPGPPSTDSKASPA